MKHRTRPTPIVIPSDIAPNRLNYALCGDVIDKVDRHVYLGNINSVSSHILKLYNIRAIVSIQSKRLDIESDMPILRVYIKDGPDEDIGGLLDVVADFVATHTAHGHNVLIHCTAGVSRSPTFVIGYLMKYKNMRFQTALDFVKQRRRCSSPNLSFLTQLSEWHCETN